MTSFEDRLDAMEYRLANLEARARKQPEIVLVEEMGRDEAKRRIESYFETHDEADTEELMSELRIDLRLLVELLDELKKEGKIASV